VVGTKSIRYRGGEQAALLEANAVLMVVRAKPTSAEDIAAILIRHIKQVYRFV
jgi:hypothetical protein